MVILKKIIELGDNCTINHVKVLISMLVNFCKKIDHHKKTVLKLIVGLSIIGIILHFVDFSRLKYSFMHMNALLLLPIIVTLYSSRALMAYKWNPLLRALGVRAQFRLLFQLYIASPTVGNFISGVGAEFFRAYGVSKNRTDMETVLASIAMERALGLFAILLIVLISLGLASYLLADELDVLSYLWWIPSLCALLIIIMFAAFFWFKDLPEAWISWVPRLPVLKQLYQVFVVTLQFSYHFRTISIVFALTFLQQLVPIGIYYLMTLCLHVDVSILELIVIVPILIMANRLPISFNGIGFQEGAAVALFSLVGVTPAEALLMSGVIRILEFVCALPICFHYLITNKSIPIRRTREVLDDANRV